MTTQILDFTQSLQPAIELLSRGGVLAFPTETVFGIGADIFNPSACMEIFKLKERDKGKPLAAHVSSIEMAETLLADPPALFYQLAENFLPGPLAIISKKNDKVSDLITSGFDTISIRFPSDATCLKLISAFGKPIAATSANISGNHSLYTSDCVYREFAGKIEIIIAGKSEIGTESTIISIADKPKLLRIGAISKEQIEDTIHILL